MKLDTSSYYPRSPLDDAPYMPGDPTDPTEPARDAEDAQVSDSPADETPSPAEGPSAPAPVPDLPPTAMQQAVTNISHLLSWILVPLMMPVYGTLLAFGLSILAFTGMGVRLAFVGVVFAFNVLIPSVAVIILKRMGFVRDIGLNDRDERLIPYLICISCLVGTALFMTFKGAPMWLVCFYYGGAAAGLVEVVINRWWKISVHAAGMAGLVAMLLHLLLYDYSLPGTFAWLLTAIALAGMLGSARIWLGRHTLAQVLAGYAVGFCAVYFLMMIQ